ncbi:MAG: ParB/RepB/Spo0J family partition protein [Clostridiales bacterium]|jgi:ParB family chromosome partitioning protein|nr:ParB/RepB/Spo0J family partition protein [Clostridiales bacterium]
MPAVLKKGLGRGLGALIADAEFTGEEYAKREDSRKTGVMTVDINRIEPSKQQPRKYFDEEALNQLADSIRTYGIIQPLIVKEENGYYSIIAGERRWRAARRAGLAEVPVLVKDYTETDTLQIALIENLQRQDLNPIEEATCYQKLIEEFFFTQDDVATRIGKSRAAISYAISLLDLDKRVQGFIIESKLSPAHGRLLTKLSEPDAQFMCAESIIERDMNYHDAEILVERCLHPREPKEFSLTHAFVQKASYKKLEDDLKTVLGTKVSINDGKKKGTIAIEYYSKDELDRLILLLRKAGDAQNQI